MSFVDRFAEAFRAAIADIRTALIERGWFGLTEHRDSTSSSDRAWENAFEPNHEIGGNALDALGPEHFVSELDRGQLLLDFWRGDYPDKAFGSAERDLSPYAQHRSNSPDLDR